MKIKRYIDEHIVNDLDEIYIAHPLYIQLYIYRIVGDTSIIIIIIINN